MSPGSSAGTSATSSPSATAHQYCPIFPGPSLREHWSIEDPATAEGSHGERMRVFRIVRDEIEGRVRRFIEFFTMGLTT
jgi:protein-tyrosine-phosphatase